MRRDCKTPIHAVHSLIAPLAIRPRRTPFLLLGLIGVILLSRAVAANGQAAAGDGLTDAPPRSLINAIQADLTFGQGEGRTQHSAIAAWQRFLADGRPTEEQQVFAHWRIASMYGYNFDRSRGEDRDYTKAEQHLDKVLSLMPDAISRETTNAMTLFASLPGSAMERAQRKVQLYRRLRTISDEQINASAAKTFDRGLLIPVASLQRGVHPTRPTLAERRQTLKSRAERAEKRLVTQIEEQIAYSRQGHDAIALIEALRDEADPEHLQRWTTVRRVYENQWQIDNVQGALDATQSTDPIELTQLGTTPSNGDATPIAPGASDPTPADENASTDTLDARLLIKLAVGVVVVVGVAVLLRLIARRRK